MVWQPYLQQVTDTDVNVLWATHTGSQPAVQYGLGTNDKVTVTGCSRRIEALDMQLHRVQLTGLQPDTRYHYQIYVDDRLLPPRKSLSFRTAPSVGSDTPFTFIAFGDYGNGSAAQKRLRNQMRRDSFRFMLTTGDNSQGEGTYQQLDRMVFQVYETIFSQVPVFPALGNHDYLTDQAAPYLNIFDVPQNARQEKDVKRYYSFTYGNVEFIVLDTTPLVKASDPSTCEAMLHWLHQELSPSSQFWKIVVCHHPPHNAGHHGVNPRIKTKLIPIFEAYDVNVVLSGHQHNYQRSKPLRQEQVTTMEEGGILYIVSGAGAAALHTCDEAEWLARTIASVKHGIYNRFTVGGDTMTIEAIDDQGNVVDICTLNKSSSVATPVIDKKRDFFSTD
ncbi:MAG: metallophosphoesterase family protein [Anaerolineae bacterium]|nr:metallophosphoesterase family protein [Anaerolineae bacterium]